MNSSYYYNLCFYWFFFFMNYCISLNFKTFNFTLDQFNKLLVLSHKDETYILLSAKNGIIQLSQKTFHEPFSIRYIGPVNDSVLCTEPNKCSFSICNSDLKERDMCREKSTDVFVKTWSYADGLLVVCYNVYQGFCETINLDKGFANNTSGRAYSIVTSDIHSHSTILQFANRLYVAIEINQKLNYQSIDFCTMTVRTLPSLNFEQKPFFYQWHMCRFGSGTKQIFPLEFKGSFYVKDKRPNTIEPDYIFFLVNQPENKIDPKNGKYQVRLARICAKDDEFSSFIDVGLNCGNPALQNYYQIDSWHLSSIGNDLAEWYKRTTRYGKLRTKMDVDFNTVLYINYKVMRVTDNYVEPENRLVTCAYPVAEIMELFDIIRIECFMGKGSINERPYDAYSSEAPCVFDNYFDENYGFCGGAVQNKHIIGDHYDEFSGKGFEVFRQDGFRGNSLAAFSVNKNHTVMLIGADNGYIYEIELFQNKSKQLSSTKVFNSAIVEMKYDERNQMAYAVSQSKFAVVNIFDCETKIDCESCVQYSPYCGWCILYGKCTNYTACKNNFFIEYERNATLKRCPVIPNLNPISISQYPEGESKVSFLISNIATNSILEYSKHLKCHFSAEDGSFISESKVEYDGSNSAAACNRPLKHLLPNISMNTDSITLNLTVLINGSFFVIGNYSIFDCSRDTTCRHCVNNKFGCSWCLTRNKCTDEFSHDCPKDSQIHKNTTSSCPSAKTLSNLIFHSGQPINIEFIVENFDVHPTKESNFYCKESCRNTIVQASKPLDKYQCFFGDIPKDYHSQNGIIRCMLNITLKIGKSSNTLLYSRQFEIVNCSSLAQHCDDCVNLPRQYNCGYCIKSKNCSTKTDCPGEWINNEDEVCPDPDISAVIPSNSTLRGETIIVVKGRNLGFRAKDIQDSVKLENKNRQISCRLLDKFYVKSKQFGCQIQALNDDIGTPVEFELVYRSKKAYLARSTFSFFSPVVSSISPTFGPSISGTIITINGQYLDVGSKVTIIFLVGEKQTFCEIISIEIHQLKCRMKGLPALSKMKRKRSATVYENDSIQSSLIIMFDQQKLEFKHIQYSFYPDPKNVKIQRNNFMFSGGQYLTISGANLRKLSNPSIQIHCDHIFSLCEVCTKSANDIECVTPVYNISDRPLTCSLIFSMENCSVDIYNRTINIYPVPIFKQIEAKKALPPTYLSFMKRGVKEDTTVPFKFEVENQLHLQAFDRHELNVSIGGISCRRIVISSHFIECDILSNEVNVNQMYKINIMIGRYSRIELGDVEFIKGDISLDSPTIIIIIVIVFIVLILIIVFSVLMVKKVKKKLQRQHREENIFTEKVIKEANDVIRTGLSQLNDSGIRNDIVKKWNSAPIHPFNVYVLYNFFSNTHPRLIKEHFHRNNSFQFSNSLLEISRFKYDHTNPSSHPLIFNKQIQVVVDTQEYSRKLSKLFEDQLFVLMFFSFLDQYDDLDWKKSDIVSLLSIILMQDMAHYTTILKLLIKNDYDKRKESGDVQSMFRHSDLLAKLLSNWFTILMYDHLQNGSAGGDLLILYLSILNVVNSGPIHADTNESQYALNEKFLLKGKVEFVEITIKVTYHKNQLPYQAEWNDEDDEVSITIKVLDCDSISQVKMKIFEEIYRFFPYSSWSRVDDYDLAKLNTNEEEPANEELIRKKYVLRELVNNCHRKVKDYQIKNGDEIYVVPKDMSYSVSNTGSVSHSYHSESKNNSLKTTNSLTMAKAYNTEFIPRSHHLSEGPMDYNEKSKLCHKRKKKHTVRMTKDISQTSLIYAQVLKTKIEPKIKSLFDDIFDNEVPYFVKDLFCHFSNICKDETNLFIFKSNSLILRFWVHIISNIDFLFDIPLCKHVPVLDCMKCVGRVLMDVCSTHENNDVWLTQLFRDVIETYRPKVVTYYDSIKNMPNGEFHSHYNNSVLNIEGINISLAIVLLYHKYIKSVHSQLVETIKRSNNSLEKQNEWINILRDVNNLYTPECFFIEDNGKIETTTC